MIEVAKRGALSATQAMTTLLMLGVTGSALGAAIELPNPDFRLRWDNTVRYTLGMRTEGQDSRIMRNPSYDESDGKFDKGDIVTNRLDLLSEIDFSYRRDMGARVSASAWYDHAYRDDDVKSYVQNPDSSYDDNHYSSEVDRFVHGPSGEILDAFVWGNFRLGESLVNVKVGRHTNFWGEGLLFGAHAISYSQAPTDGVKAVTSPGIEIKEVFRPLGRYRPRLRSPTSSLLRASISTNGITPASLMAVRTSAQPTRFSKDRIACRFPRRLHYGARNPGMVAIPPTGA